MSRPPHYPHELFIDLTEVEGNPIAHLLLEKTDPSRAKAGLDYPAGLTLSAEIGAHGADVHLNWAEMRLLRNALSRLLEEAGQD